MKQKQINTFITDYSISVKFPTGPNYEGLDGNRKRLWKAIESKTQSNS
eukprot:gene26823-biopygen17412